MGTILSQVVGKLLGGGPLCDSECHHVQCCTSTQRVVDPRWPCPERPRQISDSTASDKSTGRSFFRRKKRMSTTIYVDSRKRTAGDDSSFEFDIGETLHLQTGAKLSVFKFRVADAFPVDRSGTVLVLDRSSAANPQLGSAPRRGLYRNQAWPPGSRATTGPRATTHRPTKLTWPTTATAAS